MATRTWDIYCRVIDNLGDAGVCWRLARDLATRGRAVRLIIDDTAPLAIMAPSGASGVTVLPWPGPDVAPGDVVIEAFGCELPAGRVASMASAAKAPVWLNLEYLSAEKYVERSHGLPSPQRNGLMKWFFYPGFTPRTGGLIRESGLLAARSTFDRNGWLARLGLQRRPGERVITLFCYDNPRIPELLTDLANEPTLLLLTPDHAQRQVIEPLDGRLRTHRLPWLDQADFDSLLWASDLNFVRGEDSLVRALWAGSPFIWQIYPQQDGAHAAKLQAFLDWSCAAPEVAGAWHSWNGKSPGGWAGMPPLEPWAEQARALRQRLLGQDDLVTQLLAFADSKAGCDG